MTTKIAETEDYVLVTDESIEEDTSRRVYQVVNKEHDVIEVETSIYPEGRSYMDSLQEAVDGLKKDDAPSSGENVVKLH